MAVRSIPVRIAEESGLQPQYPAMIETNERRSRDEMPRLAFPIHDETAQAVPSPDEARRIAEGSRAA
jgi:hypothetical protein